MTPVAFAVAWVGGLSFVFVLAIILHRLYLWLVGAGRTPSPERLEKDTERTLARYKSAQAFGDNRAVDRELARLLRLYQTKGVRFRG